MLQPSSGVKDASAKGEKDKGEESGDAGQPGSPREPDGPTTAAKPVNIPSRAAKAGAGSRAQSLRTTASFDTRYHSLPASGGPISRDVLRASLARQVVQSAGADPPPPEEPGDDPHRAFLERQSLGGTSPGIGGSLRDGANAVRAFGQSLSWRATSVESVRKFVELEMAPPLVPAAAPQTPPEHKGTV